VTRVVPLLAALGLAAPGAAQDVTLAPVANVPSPVAGAHAGDERLFVVDLRGRIFVWSEAGGLLPTPFLDIRNLVTTEGEGGLLSMAFHPDYAQNGLFFVSYTAPSPFRSVLARFRAAGDPERVDPLSRRVLLELVQPTNIHNGGAIAFGPDGFLYATFGDGGSNNDPFCRAQRDDDLFGSVIRIDVDQGPDAPPFYGIPADNPFAGDDGIPDEIWATGLRNPWRLSFDRATGDLYLGDVGEATAEEINRQAAGSGGGQDYGWRVMEGSSCFDDGAAADPDCPDDLPGCFDPGFTPPIFDYVHLLGDRSVVGGFVYNGERLPFLRGRYVFGDFISGRIWALERRGSAWIRTPLAMAAGLVSFAEDAQGELYAMELFASRVLRLERAETVEPRVACIRALNTGFEKIARHKSANLLRCAREAAEGKLPVRVDACTLGDASGKATRTARQLSEEEDRVCEGVPALGPRDSQAIVDAASGLAAGWAREALGDDLEAGTARRASDKRAAHCQARVLEVLADCERQRLREFNRCKRLALRDGHVEGAVELAACLEADPRRRIARACPPHGKRARQALKGCAGDGVDLGAAFPGCDGGGAGELAACLDRGQRCRVCLALSAADRLLADCDVFDDRLANGSCS